MLGLRSSNLGSAIGSTLGAFVGGNIGSVAGSALGGLVDSAIGEPVGRAPVSPMDAGGERRAAAGTSDTDEMVRLLRVIARAVTQIAADGVKSIQRPQGIVNSAGGKV